MQCIKLLNPTEEDFIMTTRVHFSRIIAGQVHLINALYDGEKVIRQTEDIANLVTKHGFEFKQRNSEHLLLQRHIQAPVGRLGDTSMRFTAG